MRTGVVRVFDRQKGSGMIAPDDGGTEVFVHVSAVEQAGLPNLNAGDRVSFDVHTDHARGKSFARNLSLLETGQ